MHNWFELEHLLWKQLELIVHTLYKDKFDSNRDSWRGRKKIQMWDKAGGKVGLSESRFRHLKMLFGVITPTTKIIRESIVWCAEISCCDDNRWAPLQAPEDMIHTSQFKAAATGTSSVKQPCTQPSTVFSVACLVKVSISTSASWDKIQWKKRKFSTRTWALKN